MQRSCRPCMGICTDIIRRDGTCRDVLLLTRSTPAGLAPSEQRRAGDSVWRRNVARVLCVLYDDPVASRPGGDARGAIPNIGLYPDGQTLPSPATVDFLPGELLGDLSGRLGLAQFLAERGHPLTATSQHDGPDSVFERALPEAEIVISQGCWPACLPAER